MIGPLGKEALRWAGPPTFYDVPTPMVCMIALMCRMVRQYNLEGSVGYRFLGISKIPNIYIQFLGHQLPWGDPVSDVEEAALGSSYAGDPSRSHH